jgi:ankyrin repeat protein
LKSANNCGLTSLKVAANKGHVEDIREVLKYGAKLKRANNNGWTPLKVAASKGHFEVVRELLKHGAI